jgi:hypothetical protein
MTHRHRLPILAAMILLVWQSAPLFHAYGILGGLLLTLTALGSVWLIIWFVEARAAKERRP